MKVIETVTTTKRQERTIEPLNPDLVYVNSKNGYNVIPLTPQGRERFGEGYCTQTAYGTTIVPFICGTKLDVGDLTILDLR